LGRIAAARFIAWSKLSIALLTMILEIHISLNDIEAVVSGSPVMRLEPD
jgi:hypothetical protein